MRSPVLAAFLAVALTFPAAAQEPWTSSRPDGHAPIGVMGDHRHEAGEVMLSYRFMRMSMDGLRDGTDQLTPGDVLQDYPVTPVNMDMTMHMVGLMYAPADIVTFMAMLPIVDMEMEHRTGMGGTFTTASSGVGDLGLSALVGLANRNHQEMHLMLGFSVPTGSIEEKDVTPASAPNEVILPYPMQTGSGSVDLKPGFTYLGQTTEWSWGAQAQATIRVADNHRDYRLGNAMQATAWLARRWSGWFSTSVRVQGNRWGDVQGADPALNPMMVPTADPNLRGGTRWDAALGLNFEVARGPLHGQRLAAEFVVPVYQSLQGPQLETDYLLILGWQYAFALYGE